MASVIGLYYILGFKKSCDNEAHIDPLLTLVTKFANYSDC